MRRRAAAGAVVVAGCAGSAADARLDTAPPAVDGWFFQSVVDNPDGRTSYVGRLTDLGVQRVDLGDTLEVPGNGRAYVDGGRAWVGSGEEPVITPVLLGDELGLVDGRAVSLAATGLPASPFGHAFLEDGTLALFGAEISLLDPLAMELVGSAALTDAMVGGRLPDAGVGVVQGDRVLVPVTYEAFPNVDPAVYVMVLDAASGAVRAVWSDDRCRGTGSLSLAADGTAYVSGSNGYVLPDFGQDDVPPTCVLRIRPSDGGIDPDWIVDLREATGGRDATGLQLLDDATAAVFVFDPDELPSEAAADRALYYTEPASRWWLLDLHAGTAEPIDGLPWVPSGSGIASALGDGTALLALPDAYPALSNRMVRVSADGSWDDALVFTGRGVVWPLLPDG